ncbi:probable extracellular serine proteinase at C-terminar half [Coccomyxa sp. Obi]|nr:probable extracellular serine proteinase at C-terminar half [Coccomyxa sp. Obi]
MGLSPQVTLLAVIFVQLAFCNIGILGRRLSTADSPLNQGFTGQLAERPRHEKVIVFKSWSALREAWQACSGLPNSAAAATAAPDQGNGSLGGNSPDASITSANPSCHFPGVCVRLYMTAVPGFAGSFTDAQYKQFVDCYGHSIKYAEDDIQVVKAEGPQLIPGLHERRRKLLNSTSIPIDGQDTDEFAGVDNSEDSTNSPQLLALEAPLQKGAGNLSTSGLLSSYFSYGSDGVLAAGTGVKQQLLQRASWNLDRLDQHSPVIDGIYRFGRQTTVETGKKVTIYTIDSGIRKTHQEFQAWSGGHGRASYGWNFAGGANDANASDCDGHGTHVASTAVGRTVGVAKEASVVALRVLDCAGSGRISDVVAALDWLATNHVSPAIATLSLGVPEGQWSEVLSDSVSHLIQDHAVTVIVAAGNSAVDSCLMSPGNVNGTLNVAASDLGPQKFNGPQSDATDSIYQYSNTGSCVDLFAPGTNILAACGGAGRCNKLNDSAYAWASGTSMAVPHAAGVAAIYLADHPNASPKQVIQAITSVAIKNSIQSTALLPGTPNLLLTSDLYGDYSSRVTAAAGP